MEAGGEWLQAGLEECLREKGGHSTQPLAGEEHQLLDPLPPGERE